MASQQNKNFGHLYKRAKTGKIQFWAIEVSTKETQSTIQKKSGQLGTENPINHNEALTEGKNIGRSNETTHYEQALLQAESDWKKKRDEGYKSLEDLGITLENGQYVGRYGSEIMTIGPDLDLALSKMLPEFNTDASGNIKPMLATDIEKIKKIDFPVIVQPKLDGFRCLVLIEKGKVTLLSRSGKTFDLPHIAQAIENSPNINSETDLRLDGELYIHGVSFQAVSKAIKKPNHLTPQIKYYCYDLIDFDATQRTRNMILNQVIPNCNEVQHVQNGLAHTRSEITEMHDGFVQMGYEGAIARTPSGKYISARSRDLMKVKQFDDEEFSWIGWELGQRGTEDLVAICRTKDGKVFNAKMQGTRAHKEELYNAALSVGSQLTVKFFGLSEDGIPRFPVGKAFRDGKE